MTEKLAPVIPKDFPLGNLAKLRNIYQFLYGVSLLEHKVTYDL